MLYRAIETDDLINMKDTDRAIVDLMENNGSHLKLIGLKKNQILESHMAHTDVCLYVMDGEIEIIFNSEDNCACQACGCSLPDEDDEEGKKYKIKKGQMFFFEKDVMHTVKALKDSSFLAIKI